MLPYQTILMIRIACLTLMVKVYDILTDIVFTEGLWKIYCATDRHLEQTKEHLAHYQRFIAKETHPWD